MILLISINSGFSYSMHSQSDLKEPADSVVRNHKEFEAYSEDSDEDRESFLESYISRKNVYIAVTIATFFAYFIPKSR